MPHFLSQDSILEYIQSLKSQISGYIIGGDPVIENVTMFFCRGKRTAKSLNKRSHTQAICKICDFSREKNRIYFYMILDFDSLGQPDPSFYMKNPFRGQLHGPKCPTKINLQNFYQNQLRS